MEIPKGRNLIPHLQAASRMYVKYLSGSAETIH